MPHVAMIKLPEARGLQLKSIAARYGLTVTGFIERAINEEITRGTIEDALPGFRVETAGRRVSLTLQSVSVPELEPPMARFVALLLERLAIGRGKDRGQQVEFSKTERIALLRVGKGIVIKGFDWETEEEQMASMTPAMAVDLARQIRAAADRIEANR